MFLSCRLMYRVTSLRTCSPTPISLAQEPVEVLAVPQGRLKWSDLLEHVFSIKGGADPETQYGPRQQVGVGLGVERMSHAGVTLDDGARRIALEDLEHGRQPTRGPEVVDIEKADDRAGRAFDTDIPGRRRPRVAIKAHAFHAISERSDDFGCAVGRTVVDHDDFQRLVSLRQNVGHSFPQKPLAIKNGNDRAQEQGRGSIEPRRDLESSRNVLLPL